MVERLSLRPATGEDAGFLYRLYSSTRDDVLAAPWGHEEREAFLRMQWAAQQRDYETRFPDAIHSIIAAAEGDVGRIWIDRRIDEIRMLDIALLPEYRNTGIGAELVSRLIEASRAEGKPLRHSVYKQNGDALRFYRRLGFEVIEDFGVYVLMEWVEPQSA